MDTEKGKTTPNSKRVAVSKKNIYGFAAVAFLLLLLGLWLTHSVPALWRSVLFVASLPIFLYVYHLYNVRTHPPITVKSNFSSEHNLLVISEKTNGETRNEVAIPLRDIQEITHREVETVFTSSGSPHHNKMIHKSAVLGVALKNGSYFECMRSNSVEQVIEMKEKASAYITRASAAQGYVIADTPAEFIKPKVSTEGTLILLIDTHETDSLPQLNIAAFVLLISYFFGVLAYTLFTNDNTAAALLFGAISAFAACMLPGFTYHFLRRLFSSLEITFHTKGLQINELGIFVKRDNQVFVPIMPDTRICLHSNIEDSGKFYFVSPSDFEVFKEKRNHTKEGKDFFKDVEAGNYEGIKSFSVGERGSLVDYLLLLNYLKQHYQGA